MIPMLICVFGVSAVNPAGESKSTALTAGQVRKYSQLSARERIDSESSFTSLTREYAYAECKKSFGDRPDLAWITFGGAL